VEQQGNMLVLWQSKSIMKAEMMLREIFVYAQLQLTELIQQQHKYVE
jgi:hypothetical protein